MVVKETQRKVRMYLKDIKSLLFGYLSEMQYLASKDEIDCTLYDEGCPKQIVARISLIKKEYFDTKDPVKITFAVSMNS